MLLRHGAGAPVQLDARSKDRGATGIYTENVLERAKVRALPIVTQAGESAPMVTVCCNACRTCVTTNLFGLALAGAGALAVGVRRFARRLVDRRP